MVQMLFASENLSTFFGRAPGILILFLFAEIGAWAGVPAKLQTYTHAREIQELSPLEAGRGQNVKLRGVITFVDEQTGDMFVQDDSAGIFIFVKKSHTEEPLHAGQIVTIAGITTAGDFSPCVTDAVIKVVGKGPFPRPKRPSIDILMGGKEDGHWAEVEGVVRSGEIKRNQLLLNVGILGGSVVAIMMEYPRDWMRSLIDAKVVLRGAIAQLHNNRRQTVGVRIMIPPGAFEIESAPPADPFSLPQSSTALVRAYQQGKELEHRIRVRGVVTAVEPGNGLYIASADGNLQVKGYPACVARAGDVVDVVGFPGSIGTRPGLLDSACQWVSSGASMKPNPLKAAQVLLPLSFTDPSGDGFEAGMRHDMSLIRIDGTLLQSSRGPDGHVLLLEADGKQFAGILPVGEGDSRVSVEIGSRIQLTGVCLVTYDEYRRAESFRVMLRGVNDVVVLATAPWWNLQNALRALSIMAVFLMAAMFWVARQTLRLRRANASLQRLSFQDGLTGVANRRKFDETLEAELRRASKSLTPISLLMVDLDYFKALNDRYGHQRGDECLIQVGHVLQSVSLRASDLVARYGGEEFALILPGSEAEGALAVAERIRVAVLDLAIRHDASPFHNVLSISAGVATVWPDAGTCSASLIALADRALYRSKVLGRNRTSFMDACPEGSGSSVLKAEGVPSRAL